MSMLLGYYVAVRGGKAPPALNALIDVFDIVLDLACALTYLATVAFATSFGRTCRVGRRATRA